MCPPKNSNHFGRARNFVIHGLAIVSPAVPCPVTVFIRLPSAARYPNTSKLKRAAAGACASIRGAPVSHLQARILAGISSASLSVYAPIYRRNWTDNDSQPFFAAAELLNLSKRLSREESFVAEELNDRGYRASPPKLLRSDPFFQ